MICTTTYSREKGAHMMATTRYRVERASARGLIGAESVLCFCDIYSKRRVSGSDPCAMTALLDVT